MSNRTCSRAGHDQIEFTFDHEQSCLVNCKAAQQSEESKEIYCVAVSGSKLQLKKEVNRPGVSVKLCFSFRSKQVQLP